MHQELQPTSPTGVAGALRFATLLALLGSCRSRFELLPGDFETGQLFDRLHRGPGFTEPLAPDLEHGEMLTPVSLDGAWPADVTNETWASLVVLRPPVLRNVTGAFFGELSYGGRTYDFALLLHPEPRGAIGVLRINNLSIPIAMRAIHAAPLDGGASITLTSSIKSSFGGLPFPGHFTVGLHLTLGVTHTDVAAMSMLESISVAIVPCHLQSKKWRCEPSSLSVAKSDIIHVEDDQFWSVSFKGKSWLEPAYEGPSSDTTALLRKEVERRRTIAGSYESGNRECITPVLQHSEDCLFCPTHRDLGEHSIMGVPVRDNSGSWHCPLLTWSRNACKPLEQEYFAGWYSSWLHHHSREKQELLRRAELTELLFIGSRHPGVLQDEGRIVVGVQSEIYSCRADTEQLIEELESALLSTARDGDGSR